MLRQTEMVHAHLIHMFNLERMYVLAACQSVTASLSAVALPGRNVCHQTSLNLNTYRRFGMDDGFCSTVSLYDLSALHSSKLILLTAASEVLFETKCRLPSGTGSFSSAMLMRLYLRSLRVASERTTELPRLRQVAEHLSPHVLYLEHRSNSVIWSHTTFAFSIGYHYNVSSISY